MKKIITITIIILIFLAESNARSYRVIQLPNGNVNSCLNCHDDPKGGKTTNAFGTECKTNFMSGNNVVWNSAFANLDSDGDGFTNGQELQDANGTWVKGTTNPGDSSLVSNPGNASSIPSGTSVEAFHYISGFNLISISPNPISSNSNINFILNNAGNVKMEVFNNSGMFIIQLVNHEFNSGSNSIPMKVNNLSSGTYFIKITFNKYSHFEKILIVK